MSHPSLVGIVLNGSWSSLVVALVACIVGVCVYRRTLHPLAGVPGPILPAVTMLYQTYFNCKFYLEVERLHAVYGPIVRINPNEVHISDTESYDKINFSGSQYSKASGFYDSLNAPWSTFGANANALHKLRRGAINPMFSRGKVLELEAVVQQKAAKLCGIVRRAVNGGRTADLHHAFRALSIDVASEYAFGSENCYDFLADDDVRGGERFCEMARGIGPAFWIILAITPPTIRHINTYCEKQRVHVPEQLTQLYRFQQLPALQKIALATPPWLAPYLSTPLGYLTRLQTECAQQIDAVKAKLQDHTDPGRQTIFTTLLSPEGKPKGYRVPPTWQIKDEAFGILVAAADTTGNAMTVAAFHVLHDPNIYARLSAELQSRFPDATAQLAFLELEKLPYLTGVIKEGLRLSFGVIGRLPRVVPSGGATFHGYYLPAGTVVSMSSWLQHRNPDIWGDDPMKFDPDRWLDPITFHALDRHIVAFGKGPRQCVGMPLAYAEMYITLGSLFRRFPSGLRTKTSVDIMTEYEDYFSSYHPFRTRDQWLSAYIEPTK